jgi:hypothetical protein
MLCEGGFEAFQPINCRLFEGSGTGGFTHLDPTEDCCAIFKKIRKNFFQSKHKYFFSKIINAYIIFVLPPLLFRQ